MLTLISHTKNQDGSFTLVVSVDGEDHEFQFGPLPADATHYDGGPAISEEDYVASQRAEVKALLEAQLDAAAPPVVLASNEPL